MRIQAVRGCIALFLWAAVATTGHGEVVVFGDSLSDVGNLSIASTFAGGAQQALFDRRFPAPPYFAGATGVQASNGPVWVQTLSTRLGSGPTTASFAGGNNFAVIGATTGPQIPSLFDPFNTFNMSAQVGSYLGGNPSNIGSALHVVAGGTNDAFFGIGLFDPVTLANTSVGNISSQISALAMAGAQQFLVANVPALGALPQIQALDPFTVFVFNLFSDTFNQLLAAELDTLANELGVSIRELDLAAFFQQAIDDPSRFGLTNVTDAALASILDPNDPLFGFPALPIDVNANVGTFLFFDTVHPTATAHQQIGNLAFNTVVPEPAALLAWLTVMIVTVSGLRRFLRATNPLA